jgi:NAD+ synthase
MQTSKVIDTIVDWLDAVCADAGMKGFVAGVSGGIDSAVTSTLCARTGRETLVLNLPIRQAGRQVELADAHIRRLEKHHPRVRGIRIDLTPVFRTVEQTFPPEIQDGLTMANSRSRLRMLTLYAFASHHRLLVAGTGNKVEDFGIGFFTKYGDGGVDLSPIGDLMKSEVFAIGEALKIQTDILRAEPTDGLWPDNRSDESQIGASYEELEWAMRFEEAGRRDAGSLTDRQKQVLDIYRRFHRANRHKIEPVPVCKIPEELK